MIKTAVILAAGKLKDISMPACMLTISSEPILTSIINILEQLKFTEIIVVVGFQSDEVKASYQNKGNIIWIENLNYEYSGTMSSLALASPYIKEDFLLLEGDLVIPTHMVEAVINYPVSVVTATSNLSGSGDEAFVETNNQSYLNGLSKDIRQLNTIHSELIGITKLSFPLFEKMLKSYSLSENNWVNYEYIMLNQRNEYPVYCLHFGNTPWIDIDDSNSLYKAKNIILPSIHIFNKNIKIISEKISSIISDQIIHISLAGGMTNINFKVTTLNNVYFVRLPGAGTSSMVNREYEQINLKKIQNLKIDAPTILIDRSDGIKITEYISNSITFSKRTARLPQNLEKTAKLLSVLHHSNVDFINRFNFIEVLEQYIDLLKKPIEYKDFQQTLIYINLQYKWLESNFEYCEGPCHNDLVPENFLLNETGKLFLIDWEYSGMNDCYWDLASYLLESEATVEETTIFLTYYFERMPKQKDLLKIKIYQAFQDILWAIWSLVKKEKNINDFITYGQQRYERGSKTIKELIKYV